MVDELIMKANPKFMLDSNDLKPEIEKSSFPKIAMTAGNTKDKQANQSINLNESIGNLMNLRLLPQVPLSLVLETSRTNTEPSLFSAQSNDSLSDRAFSSTKIIQDNDYSYSPPPAITAGSWDTGTDWHAKSKKDDASVMDWHVLL